MKTVRDAPPSEDLVPLLGFSVGLARATAALAGFILELGRAELPDPIDLQPRILRPVWPDGRGAAAVSDGRPRH